MNDTHTHTHTHTHRISDFEELSEGLTSTSLCGAKVLGVSGFFMGNFLVLCVHVCLVTQSCPSLCNPMDRSPPGSSVHGDSPGKNTGVGCHALLQRIFPTRGSNPGLPHFRQILYCLSHQGSLCLVYSFLSLNHEDRP